MLITSRELGHVRARMSRSAHPYSIRGCPGSATRPHASHLATTEGGDMNTEGVRVREYAPLVGAVAPRHGLSRADAADASQNTWVAIAGGLATLRHPERLA